MIIFLWAFSKSHWPQIIITNTIVKSVKYVSECCWENGANRIVQHRAAPDLHFVKKMREGENIVPLKQNKVKCNKMWCACCKGETVFWGSNGTMDISCETEAGSCKPRGQTYPSHYFVTLANLLAISQMVKNLPAMHKPRVQSLDQEDPLEKRMATHPSILAWRIPWTE